LRREPETEHSEQVLDRSMIEMAEDSKESSFEIDISGYDEAAQI